MKLFTAFAFIILCWTNDGIYNYQLTGINGDPINLSDFKGKKILFVNTATNNQYVNQYAALENLYQKYKDSLVIIATPSNSFGNEPAIDDSVRAFVMNTFNIHYILCAREDVSSDSISSVYRWLTNSSLNHVFQNPVGGDFFKYLLDSDGNLVAIFDGSVDPMDDQIQALIQN